MSKNKNKQNAEENSNPDISPKTWQEIAEAQKPLAQKAIELLDNPNKQLIVPVQPKITEKQINIKVQPDPTHMIVTELSERRIIESASAGHKTLKKMLKADIIKGESRKLTPEEAKKLKCAMQVGDGSDTSESDDDNLLKPFTDLAKKLIRPFSKKIKKN